MYAHIALLFIIVKQADNYNYLVWKNYTRLWSNIVVQKAEMLSAIKEQWKVFGIQFV